jgi:hypothetical protein
MRRFAALKVLISRESELLDIHTEVDFCVNRNCNFVRRGRRHSLPQLDIGTLEFEDAERGTADKDAILFDKNAIGVETRSVRGV